MTETSNHASPTTTAATTTGGKTLALLGIATCCMGAGIAALPHVSYTAAQLVSGLGIHGVIGASVFTGGALLVALGRTRKSLEDAQANSASNANTTLLLEQLATDLAQTRATLEMVQAQAAENTHCVQALRVELANSHTGTDHSGPSTEALFQLASGLDKLGARIDQKLKVHHSSLHDSLEELGATLAHTRRTLEERMATLETSGTIGVHATGINTTGATCMTGGTTPAATLAATNDGSTLELADNGWNPSEWNTPQVEGTATSGAIGELQTWGESEIGGPIGSLGLLDNFEDTRSTTTSDVDVNTVPGVADLANKLQALQALLADPALQALLGQGRTR